MAALDANFINIFKFGMLGYQRSAKFQQDPFASELQQNTSFLNDVIRSATLCNLRLGMSN